MQEKIVRTFIRRLGIPALILSAATVALQAAPVSSCNSNDTICQVYEGQTLTYPSGYFGYSGDLIVQSPLGTTVDVFRIFNDLVDTGGGTGLGQTAFLYAADLNDLPSPSTYSINAVTVLRGPNGAPGFYETDYNGNGTLYRIFTPTPEPSSWASLSLGIVAGALLWTRRMRTSVRSLAAR